MSLKCLLVDHIFGILMLAFNEGELSDFIPPSINEKISFPQFENHLKQLNDGDDFTNETIHNTLTGTGSSVH